MWVKGESTGANWGSATSISRANCERCGPSKENWIHLAERVRGKEQMLARLLAKSLQLCPTLCDPIDSSPTGSPVPGILQARILEWVAISFSNA